MKDITFEKFKLLTLRHVETWKNSHDVYWLTLNLDY